MAQEVHKVQGGHEVLGSDGVEGKLHAYNCDI